MIYEAGEDVPDPVGMIIQEFRQADLGDGMNGLSRDDDNDPMRVADVLIRDNPGFYSHLERLGLTDPFPADVTGNNEAAPGRQ